MPELTKELYHLVLSRSDFGSGSKFQHLTSKSKQKLSHAASIWYLTFKKLSVIRINKNFMSDDINCKYRGSQTC